MAWTQQLAAWYIDYFAAATLLLIVVLLAGWVVRQPVQRMAMAWSAMIALVVLAVCCAVPGWPRVPIVSKRQVAVANPLPQSVPFKTPRAENPEPRTGPIVTRHPNFAPGTQPLPPIQFPAIAGKAKRDISPQLPFPKASADLAPKPVDYSSLFAGVFISGAIIIAVWLVVGQLRARRLCRRATPAPEFAQQELRSLAGPSARLPRLLVDRILSTAAAIGLLRPTILLPAGALETQCGPLAPGAESASQSIPITKTVAPQLRALLAHEYAHIQHRDLWLLALSRLLLVLFFAHPLYHLLRRRIRTDQELLADAAAAQHCGPHEYAETLLAWARHQPHPSSRMNWALGIWQRPSQLSRRIAMLLNEGISLRTVCSRSWRVANLCAAIGIVFALSMFTLSSSSAVKAEPNTKKTSSAIPKAPTSENLDGVSNALVFKLSEPEDVLHRRVVPDNDGNPAADGILGSDTPRNRSVLEKSVDDAADDIWNNLPDNQPILRVGEEIVTVGEVKAMLNYCSFRSQRNIPTEVLHKLPIDGARTLVNIIAETLLFYNEALSILPPDGLEGLEADVNSEIDSTTLPGLRSIYGVDTNEQLETRMQQCGSSLKIVRRHFNLMLTAKSYVNYLVKSEQGPDESEETYNRRTRPLVDENLVRLRKRTKVWSLFVDEPAKALDDLIVATIGSETVLMRDLKALAADHLMRGKIEMSEDDRREMCHLLLTQLVETKLIYKDALHAIPKEALPKLEADLKDEFDRTTLPILLENDGIKTSEELAQQMEVNASSLNFLRRNYFEKNLAQGWLQQKINFRGDGNESKEEKTERIKKQSAEYLAEIRKATPVWTIFDDEAESKTNELLPLLGPITSGGQVAALDPPSDDEVIEALKKSRSEKGQPLPPEFDRTKLRIVKEKIADYVDEVKDHPLIGNAQLHHAHYKCTVYFTNTKPTEAPTTDAKPAEVVQEVVYVDHNHFHRVGDSAEEANVSKVNISGTCLDEDSKPVPNAHVRLIRLDHSNAVPKASMRIKLVNVLGPGDKESNSMQVMAGGFGGPPESQRLLQEVRTDENGRFMFAEVVADEAWQSQRDSCLFVVQTPDKATECNRVYFSRDAAGQPSVQPLSILLHGRTSLRGRITNAVGQPVAGALVYPSMYDLGTALPGILSAVTDADGRYEINDLPPFDVADLPPQPFGVGTIEYVSAIATVEHPDYAPGYIEYAQLPEQADHVLQRPAKLQGQVLFDDSDQPADKTDVTVTHENGFATSVKTDDQGRYSVEKLLPGKFTVQAKRPDRVAALQTLTLDPGEHTLDFRLKNGGMIKGRIVEDATGNPPDFTKSGGAGSVSVRLVDEEPEQAGQDWISRDGTFSVAVKPGQNLLLLAHPDWQLIDADRWIKPGIEAAEGQTVEIELRVKPRTGGWPAVFAEAERAIAIAKGETPPPAAPMVSPPEATAKLDEDEEEGFKYLLNYPSGLLPKKPLSETRLKQMLNQPGNISVEKKTIDGKQSTTMICIDGSPLTRASLYESIWLEQGVLAHIDKFPHLQRLYLIGGPLADDWLKPLREHKNLESLDLIYAQHVTSIGISHLGTLPKLTHLQVIGFKLDDSSLRELAKFPKLDSLEVGGVFTDAGLAHLRESLQLKSLNVAGLGDSKITDESLSHLAGLTNLEELQLANSKEIGVSSPSLFTDLGLQHLTGLTKLQSLFIGGERITDAGLVHLHGLKNLKKLSLSDTSVTAAGIDELKKHLPQLEVTKWTGGAPEKKPQDLPPQQKVPSADGNANHAPPQMRTAMQPAVATTAPKAQETPKARVQNVTISGICRDEHHKPLANAHVRLFRINKSDKYYHRPHGRMKIVQFTPVPEEFQKEPLLQNVTVSGSPESQKLLYETHTNEKGNFHFNDIVADDR